MNRSKEWGPKAVITGATLSLALLLTSPEVFAETAVAPEAALSVAGTVRNFEDGDVVSFIGDSITAGLRWHRYIHEFHVTRFPARRVTFVNAGISGDRADGALRRLHRDILVSQPTVAVFLMGMNDVGRGDYDIRRDAAGLPERRERRLAGFRTNVTTLSERLRANGVRRMIYCTPTPYDETVVALKTNMLVGLNSGLARCAAILRDVAHETGGEWIDLHGPMTALNLRLQQADPADSIVGWNRIHPGAQGQMAMAYFFLRAQGLPALVSSVVIDAAAEKVLESRNAEVSDLAATGDQLAFTVLEGSLPWPVEAEARKALSLLPFEKDLNQQILRIEGLKPGDYRLMIDDAVIGEFTATDLAQGINLAFREETPQFRQAQQVQALMEQRRASELRLRIQAGSEHFLFRDLGVDLDDFEAVKARLLELLALPNEEADPDAEPKEAQRRREARMAYIENKPRSADFRAELAELLNQAYAAAQPRPHCYALSRMPEAAE